ncbi:RNA polymerase ii elongation factor ell-like [Plakobranchus ocellatus]|uniref:RNA polymerase ii elongation factor ell-like n=1 Tax=Plakobranchus ocellatus TaxID=259542 RepID=A0AAV3YEF5_9GAST|nr:RNA polymerase ii elongation factor ell-like [Plakobranchus ocellatus]
MATLVEGREYGLASNSFSEEDKTVVHFKLTDAALKTLENYARVKNGKASIQFQGAHGQISMPGFGGSPGQTFQISLSALPGDLNGSFDCIQQTSKGGSSSLECLGTMSYRVAVHATDDVYDQTRAKMTMAEEESKKICTKEIKPSGRNIGRKVKKILPPGSLRIPPVSKPPTLVSKVPCTANSRQSFGLSSTIPPQHLPSSSPKEASSTMSNLSGLSRHSPLLNSNMSSTTNKPSSCNSNQQSRILMSTTAKQSSGAINMPYRDRVIHLLALRPYKKPELIHRLQKDGIREKDKNSLGTVLQQVAVMSKDNSYTLARASWADVRLEWPFYSDEDKFLVKRNLQLESRANHTSPAVSPASSNPESPGNNQKRALTDETEETGSNPNKRKRIAHTDRRAVEEKPVSVVKPTLNQQSSPTANRENFDVNEEDDNDDKPDYLRKFKEIVDSKQRQLYKSEFNKEYKEYKDLHKEVDAVARKFQNLRSQIDQTEEGTPDFEVLKQQVLEEYEAQKSDPKFMEKKGRMNYLHHKLGHIKRLIHDFDRGQAQVCS